MGGQDRGRAIEVVRRCDLRAHVVVFEIDPKAVPQAREGISSFFAKVFEGQPPIGGELLHHCVGVTSSGLIVIFFTRWGLAG